MAMKPVLKHKQKMRPTIDIWCGPYSSQHSPNHASSPHAPGETEGCLACTGQLEDLDRALAALPSHSLWLWRRVNT